MRGTGVDYVVIGSVIQVKVHFGCHKGKEKPFGCSFFNYSYPANEPSYVFNHEKKTSSFDWETGKVRHNHKKGDDDIVFI